MRYWPAAAGFDPIEDRLRENIRATIEAVFDEELGQFLGQCRYGRGGEETPGYRHGHPLPPALRQPSLHSGVRSCRSSAARSTSSAVAPSRKGSACPPTHTPPNGTGIFARKADRNLVCRTHQGQRSKPRKQAGHKTASDQCTNHIKNVLLCRSHPHRTFAADARLLGYSRTAKRDEVAVAFQRTNDRFPTRRQ